MWKSVFAISVGAALGALLRWWLSAQLNHHFPTIRPGTLAANLIGGYVIGLAIGFFAHYSALSPEWRLLVVTGFCGGLTTFSTYSAELVTLLQQGRMHTLTCVCLLQMPRTMRTGCAATDHVPRSEGPRSSD